MKKNKKDIFRSAVAANLSENAADSSALGDFVNDMKDSREAGRQDESKNDLPHQKEEKEIGKSMESRLKRLTQGSPSTATPAAFADDEEPPKWRKYLFFAVIGFLFLSLIYWAIFSPGQKPAIYLSNTAIEETGAKNLHTTNLIFPRNKTLYMFFASGGRLGQEKIIVKLTEIYADSSNMTKEEAVAQKEDSVKASWRYFTTHFQKENFDHAGRFRIHVLSPNGEVIASQEFRVQ